MNTNLTEIGFVLDRSGSMRLEAQNGFNAFLDAQQKLPGEARLSLVLFDHEYLIAHNGAPIEVPPLNRTYLFPSGHYGSGMLT
jgi:hypothetical protein